MPPGAVVGKARWLGKVGITSERKKGARITKWCVGKKFFPWP
jgi:hypothetical protein